MHGGPRGPLRAATDLVADLVAVVANQPDMIVEDALCPQLGTLLGEAEQAQVDDRPGPRHLADAIVAAAAAAAAVEATTGEADAWRAPWRVLTAVADILPYPDSEAAVDAIARLQDTAGGRTLPAAPLGPVVTGPVLWTRDRYGSRFAVAAPITTVGQPVLVLVGYRCLRASGVYRPQWLLFHSGGGVGCVAGRGRPDRCGGHSIGSGG